MSYDDAIAGVSAGAPTFRWRLDGNTNEVGGHSTSSSGTMSWAASIIPNQAGQCWQSNGAARINPANSADINTDTSTERRSISLWFEADALTGRRNIYEEGGGTHGWDITLYDDSLVFNITQNGASRAHVEFAGLTIGATYHVVGVFDLSDQSSGANMQLYVNGSLAGTANFTTQAFLNAHSGDIQFGQDADGRAPTGFTTTLANFSGRIQDVCYWSELELTAQDATDIYTAGTVSGTTYDRAAAIASASTVAAAAEVVTIIHRSASVSGESGAWAWWNTTTGGAVAFDTQPLLSGVFGEGNTLTVEDAVTYQAAAQVAAASSVSASPVVTTQIDRSAAITATSSVTATPQVTVPTTDRAAAVTAVSDALARWTVTNGGAVAFTSPPDITGTVAEGQTLTVNDGATFQSAAAVAAQSTVAAQPAVSGEVNRAATVTAASTVTASVTLTRRRAAAVVAASAVSAQPQVTSQFDRAASVSAASTVTAQAVRTLNRSAAVASASIVTASAITGSQINRSAAVTSASTVSAAGSIIRNRAAQVSAAATVEAIADVDRLFQRAASIGAASAVSARAGVTRRRSVAISGGAAVSASFVRIFARAANVTSSSDVAAIFIVGQLSRRRIEPAVTSANGGTMGNPGRGGTLTDSSRGGTLQDSAQGGHIASPRRWGTLKAG